MDESDVRETRAPAADLVNQAVPRSPKSGEMRVDVGAGYRVYFTRRRRVVIILLCGGDKATQTKDIARAKLMAHAI